MTRRIHPKVVRAAAAAPRLDRPKVVAGYLRLTEDRDGNKIGYQVQKDAIAKWAAAFGYQVVWFKDEDLSAAKREIVRPEYEGMLARVAAGEFVGIAVWRLDRLVRLTREFERCFGIAEDASAFIYDTSLEISTRSDIGKMLMRLLVMLAEMEIAGMRARAKGHQQLRASKGEISSGGPRPFGFVGYEKDPDTGVILNREVALRKHHPAEAQLIRDAANRIAYNGASYVDIVREWSRMEPPVRGTQGKIIETSGLHRILSSPRIAGIREYEIFDDDGNIVDIKTARGKWDPIIDEKTWEILRNRSLPYRPRTTSYGYLLTGGLAKCGECGTVMIGTRMPGGKPAFGEKRASTPSYKCNPGMKARKAGSCGGTQASAEYVENEVLERLFARIRRNPRLLEVVRKGDASGDAARREEALREIKLCDDALEGIAYRTTLHEDDPDHLSDAEERGKRKGWRDRRAKAKKVLEEVRASSGMPVPDGDDCKDLQGWFDNLALGEKRSWLWGYLAEVRLTRRTSRGRYFDPSRVITLFADAKTAHDVSD